MTRKIGERIKIGDGVVINILEISKGNVRIGIEAPRNVTILRHEVYDRIQEQNIKAAKGTLQDVEKVADFWRKKTGEE